MQATISGQIEEKIMSIIGKMGDWQVCVVYFKTKVLLNVCILQEFKLICRIYGHNWGNALAISDCLVELVALSLA